MGGWGEKEGGLDGEGGRMSGWGEKEGGLEGEGGWREGGRGRKDEWVGGERRRED